MTEIDDLLVRVQRRGTADVYSVEIWLEGGRRINERDELSLADYVELRDSAPAAR
jgi:hypothetical protein